MQLSDLKHCNLSVHSYACPLQILHRSLCARNVLLADGRLCKVTSFSCIQDVIEHHEYQRVTQVGGLRKSYIPPM